MDRLKLKKQLAEEETRDGVNPDRFAYDDAAPAAKLPIKGNLTVGYGHNLSGNGLSVAVCDAIFAEDVAVVEHELSSAFPWWSQYDEVRQRVVADLVFNMGMPVFSLFKNTIAAMKAAQIEVAAHGLEQSQWFRDTGRRARRLVDMWRTGQDNDIRHFE